MARGIAALRVGPSGDELLTAPEAEALHPNATDGHTPGHPPSDIDPADRSATIVVCMAKLSSKTIREADFEEYLKTSSDFAFELTVLKSLVDQGFECEHGGSYRDPITKKIRQFDIRASTSRDQLRVSLAVECKNLHDNYPLLVSCVPRRESESFHEVIVAHNSSTFRRGCPDCS